MRKQINIQWQEHLLAATIDYPVNMQFGRKYPLLIICHGFVGSKVGVDRLFVKTAEEMIKDKWIVLRFDYSGCGESSGEYGKTGLDDLIDQTRTVIDYAYKMNYVEQSQITLLGHSLGGATAVLTVAKDHRIKRLILWSAVAHPYKDISRIVGKEKVSTLMNVPAIDYLGYPLTDRFFNSLANYEPLQATNDFSGDVLLVHGTGDEDIPVSYVRDYENAFSNRRFGDCIKHEIDGANHTISSFDHFSELITYTSSWLKNQMNAPCYIAKS